MHPREFIQKWRAATLKERSAAHEHFVDLCRLLDERTPAEADPEGVWYCFERGARKTGGGDGWADVWKRGCFGWEYKGKRANLDDAFAQLQRYAIALENPPLLIVSDIETMRVHTNLTNTVQQAPAFGHCLERCNGVRDKCSCFVLEPNRWDTDRRSSGPMLPGTQSQVVQRSARAATTATLSGSPSGFAGCLATRSSTDLTSHCALNV